MQTRVIGLGSPHSDDQAGWLIAQRLSARSGLSADVFSVRQPIELLEHVDGCKRLVIVDACLTGVSPGSVVRLEWPDGRIARQRSTSTHGVGVGDALRLAEQLGRLPKSVVLIAVEMAETDGNASVSETVSRSLDRVERRVLDELRLPICGNKVTVEVAQR